MLLAPLYKEGALESLEEVRREWLWGTDCVAVGTEACGDMSQMHGAGLLLACLLALQPRSSQTMAQWLPQLPLLHLSAGQLAALSLRELLDQLQCLQLHWGQVLGHSAFENTHSMLDALLARFGDLAQQTIPCSEAEQEFVAPLPGDGTVGVMARRTLRSTICLFLALYRTLHIVQAAEVLPSVTTDLGQAFRIQHVESSQDDWTDLQQMLCLAPGMRLVYRTQFAGMYNNVSQVVYFHYPEFSRKPQLELQEALQSAVHTLPLVRQLLPDVPVAYDDDAVIPGLTLPKASGASASYYWLICCGSVFLGERTSGKLYASEDATLFPLLAKLLEATGRAWGSQVDEQTQAQRPAFTTAYDHVLLERHPQCRPETWSPPDPPT